MILDSNADCKINTLTKSKTPTECPALFGQCFVEAGEKEKYCFPTALCPVPTEQVYIERPLYVHEKKTFKTLKPYNIWCLFDCNL